MSTNNQSSFLSLWEYSSKYQSLQVNQSKRLMLQKLILTLQLTTFSIDYLNRLNVKSWEAKVESDMKCYETSSKKT